MTKHAGYADSCDSAGDADYNCNASHLLLVSFPWANISLVVGRTSSRERSRRGWILLRRLHRHRDV